MTLAVRVVCLVIVVGAAAVAPPFLAAEEIYVAQSSLGTDTGIDCSSAHSMAWLNTPGNWALGANKVSAGDIVHLCGVLTSTLTIQASGASGSPITILFESGARFSAPYWSSGAIVGGSNNYLAIDGGEDGVIEATDNGTAGSYTYQQASNGIVFDASPVHDVEIKNLKIRNLYVRTSITDYNSNAFDQVIGFMFHGGATANIAVHDCKFSHCAKVGLMYYAAGADSNFRFYNNVATGFHTGLMVGDLESNSHLSGLLFYGNAMNYGHDYSQGDDTDRFHADIFHTWSEQGSSTIDDLFVYDNYFGNQVPARLTQVAATSYVYLTNYGTGLYIYNNVFAMDAGEVGVSDGLLDLAPLATNVTVFNNTFSYNNSGWGNAIAAGGVSGLLVENNIMMRVRRGIYGPSVYPQASFDYNVYGSMVIEDYDTSPHSSLGIDPSLDSGFIPTLADNLAKWHGTAAGQLSAADKAGHPWHSPPSIGAYEFTSSGTPNPPTNLQAAAH